MVCGGGVCGGGGVCVCVLRVCETQTIKYGITKVFYKIFEYIINPFTWAKGENPIPSRLALLPKLMKSWENG